MRRRIIILAVTAAILAISLFGVPLAAFLAQYSWEDERTDLERVATAAALAVTNDRTQLPIAPTGTQLGHYSAAGELLTGVGPAIADRTVLSAMFRGELDADDVKDQIVVAVPIMDRNTLTGVVRAVRSHSEATLRTGLIWLTLLALAMAAVGVTWLLARRMASRLARPLENLSAAAKVLGDGDFTVRTRKSGVPEIDSVGASLDSTAQRIGDTLDRERAFSANASHQLRTPLAGLRLQLEAALESPHDPRPAIRMGIEAADRLERTINDLLALARNTETTAVANLRELLDEVESTWHGPLAAQGRPLAVELNGAPHPRAAQAAVRQILNVLVDNAFTHGQGSVRVTARDAGDALAIDVTDEGPGIPPADDPFTRKTGKGHGIGLALARSLAEADGGRLVHAQAATFTLLLPISSAGESADLPP
jgi:signal transduction histidine kinase